MLRADPAGPERPLARSALARRLLQALLVVLATVGGLAASAAPAHADNPSPTNQAIAENTKDGSSVFKLAFSVRHITGDVVTPANAAVAYASCTDCQTVAIAVQIVFVVGQPSTYAPENAAVAINESCNLCDTLATAYQFVVQTDRPVQLTKEGKRALHDIVKALRDLDGSGLTGPEIQAKVQEQMDRLAQVLATQLEPAKGHGDEQQDEQDQQSGSGDRSPPSTSSAATTTTSTVVVTTTTGSTTTTTEPPPAPSSSS